MKMKVVEAPTWRDLVEELKSDVGINSITVESEIGETNYRGTVSRVILQASSHTGIFGEDHDYSKHMVIADIDELDMDDVKWDKPVVKTDGVITIHITTKEELKVCAELVDSTKRDHERTMRGLMGNAMSDSERAVYGY